MTEAVNLIPNLTTGISGGGVVFVLYLVFQLIFNKKLRTPADDQTRIEYGVRVLTDRLDDANKDRSAMQGTIDWMRGELEKRDKDSSTDYDEKQKLRETLNEMQERLAEKERIIKENDAKLDRLAAKIARGEQITLVDIYGEETIRNIEDTVSRDDLENA